MKGIWAVPIVFGIALMLGFTPVQSNAESSACDKIEELIATGKIPLQVGLKLLEKVDCETKIFKVTTISGITGEPLSGVTCSVDTPAIGFFAQGVTDTNGELVFTVPSEATEIFATVCGILEPDFLTASICNTLLPGLFTELEVTVTLRGGTGCFG